MFDDQASTVLCVFLIILLNTEQLCYFSMHKCFVNLVSTRSKQKNGTNKLEHEYLAGHKAFGT